MTTLHADVTELLTHHQQAMTGEDRKRLDELKRQYDLFTSQGLMAPAKYEMKLPQAQNVGRLFNSSQPYPPTQTF